jgi:hypothetical protein
MCGPLDFKKGICGNRDKNKRDKRGILNVRK